MATRQITELDTEMVAWPNGTRHYRATDGTYLAVEATMPSDDAIPAGVAPMIDEVVRTVGKGRKIRTIVERPTVVIECDENGHTADLTPVARFPAGTTHEAALAEMGYEVT